MELMRSLQLMVSHHYTRRSQMILTHLPLALELDKLLPVKKFILLTLRTCPLDRHFNYPNFQLFDFQFATVKFAPILRVMISYTSCLENRVYSILGITLTNLDIISKFLT